MKYAVKIQWREWEIPKPLKKIIKVNKTDDPLKRYKSLGKFGFRKLKKK